MARLVERALALLEADPGLGGVITVGFRVEPPTDRSGAGGSGRRWQRIPPHAALAGYRTPWGWQPGLLERGGWFAADLDILPPEAQAILAQRLDEGGCTLVTSCTESPWAHLADRVAFLVSDREAPPRPAPGRVMARAAAIEAIAVAAARLAVEGHRAEALALRTAEAIARLDGRVRLREGDVAEAIALVLGPRARALPEAAAEEPSPQERRERGTGQGQEQAEAPPLPLPLPPLPPAPVQTRPALCGARVGSVASRRRRGSLDLMGTLLAALPWQRARGRDPQRGGPLIIRPGDLRWQLRRPRQGRLILFVVDGSGSMGARRLGQAKGAVLRLLQEAYRRRDQVVLILASGEEARLLLPPTRAVEQARRRLVAVPAGGGTPLSGALLMALELARRAERQDGRPSLLLLLTDGRANRPIRRGGAPSAPTNRAAVREELRRTALAVRAAGIESMVLGQPGAEAVELARWLGGSFRVIGRSDLVRIGQGRAPGPTRKT